MESSKSAAVEELSADKCWARLRSAAYGRLAVVIDSAPEIFPVNIVTDHGTLVFRTGEGTKLDAVSGGALVALEADGLSDEGSVAWSVVVKGRTKALVRTEEVLSTFGLDLFPWQAGHKDHFIRIVPEQITGRMFPLASPPSSATRTHALRPAPFE